MYTENLFHFPKIGFRLFVGTSTVPKIDFKTFTLCFDYVSFLRRLLIASENIMQLTDKKSLLVLLEMKSLKIINELTHFNINFEDNIFGDLVFEH